MMATLRTSSADDLQPLPTSPRPEAVLVKTQATQVMQGRVLRLLAGAVSLLGTCPLRTDVSETPLSFEAFLLDVEETEGQTRALLMNPLTPVATVQRLLQQIQSIDISGRAARTLNISVAMLTSDHEREWVTTLLRPATDEIFALAMHIVRAWASGTETESTIYLEAPLALGLLQQAEQALNTTLVLSRPGRRACRTAILTLNVLRENLVLLVSPV